MGPGPRSIHAVSKTLCPRCLTSVEETELRFFGGERICDACVAAATKHEPEPEQPAEAPGYAPAPQAPVVRDAVRVEGTLRQRLAADCREWCVGRVWWIRVPVLIYLAYLGFRYAVQVLHPHPAEVYVSWFDGINLGFHELGHYVFRPFGRFLHIFGATILQCVMPIIAGWFLLRQRDYFGVAFCIGWLSTNFSGVAIYMADAQTRTLPLVAPGIGRVDANMHDWWNLLRMVGMLEHAETLASILKFIAAVTMAAALWFGGWVCWTMARAQPPAPERREYP